jgi:hypothetical protein
MTEKREKFVRLAEKRVTRAIRDLRLIGNLSNKRNYSYSDSDVQRIVAALDHEVRQLKAKFVNGDDRELPRFTLD